MKLNQIVAAMSLVFVVASADAAIGRSSGGSSSSRSYGISKSAVTQPVRNNVAQGQRAGQSAQPQYQQPAQRPNSYYRDPYYTQPAQPSKRYSGGNVAAAGAAGLLGGMLLGHALTDKNPVVVQPQVAQQPGTVGAVNQGGVIPQQSYAQPDYVAAGSQTNGWDFLNTLLIIGLLGAGAFGVYYFLNNRDKKVADMTSGSFFKSKPEFDPAEMFYQINQAHAASNQSALEKLLSSSVKYEFLNQPAYKYAISGMSYEYRDEDDDEYSIWYTFTDGNANNETVNQVWHFILKDGRWLLNGIENV